MAWRCVEGGVWMQGQDPTPPSKRLPAPLRGGDGGGGDGGALSGPSPHAHDRLSSDVLGDCRCVLEDFRIPKPQHAIAAPLDPFATLDVPLSHIRRIMGAAF